MQAQGMAKPGSVYNDPAGMDDLGLMIGWFKE
jgi:hypothetical protein